MIDKPKAEWSDIDYVQDYIEGKNYIPKTNMENLIIIILLMYEGYLEDNGLEYYGIKDNRSYPDNLMINITDLDCYIDECGGLKEFDYYC